MARPSSPRSQSRPSQSQPPPKTTYLLLYNALSLSLWLILLLRLVLLLGLTGTTAHTHAALNQFTKWTQTLALAEIVHAVLGLVRSPISTTALQVASRLALVWGIVGSFPAIAIGDEKAGRGTSGSVAYSSMLFAWSLTEVVRYGYFVAMLRGGRGADGVPESLSWARYNTFFVLYPLGIASEAFLVWSGVEPAGKQWGKEASLVFWGLLGAYIPGSYILYTHMMRQRRKVARGKGRARLD